LAGIFEAQAKFGKLSPKQVLQPVIDLARNGYVITKNQAESLKNHRQIFIDVNGPNTFFGKEIKEGDTLKQPALANTLERIANKGKNEFYKGETAKILVNHFQKNGGIISKKDLIQYKAVWRDPIVFPYRDLKIISMAPPSSGGITLGQIMSMLEPHPLKKLGHHSPEYIQVLVEAERRAYADRNHYLGDPDFVNIPTKQLLDSTYLQSRMNSFSFEKASKSEDIARGDLSFSESMETTHYSIVDAEGNAVSVTTTLNGAYGSKVYLEELGFFMNNEMDDFSVKPGVPTMYGAVGAEANAIFPGKRMLSSMTTTIVLKNNQPYLVVGTPGGTTIPTSIIQSLVNMIDFKMSPEDAVNLPKFHHQWLPDEIRVEKDFNPGTIQQLEAMGYKVVKKESIGQVELIEINFGLHQFKFNNQNKLIKMIIMRN
jgi:gamma-glutamyltranspeptidase/glutathione hydrolase